MKLSELVALKIMLNSIPVKPVQMVANNELDKIIHLLTENSEAMDKELPATVLKYQELQTAFDNFHQQTSAVQHHIEKLITQEEKYWMPQSFEIYKSLSERHHDDILNTLRPIYHPDLELRSKLKMQADWRYPGLIIRPGVEDFIDTMVSYDPLYVVDVNSHMINKSIGQFGEQYQNRLRSIVIEEKLDHEILEKIPNNQIGLCFVYNFFNHRTLEYINKYLTEIYNKLRPGGMLIMSFNDCDRLPGVMLVEQHLACYTPGVSIVQMARNIGYECFYSWHNDLANTYLEIQKPGQLLSNRGGQSLAKIHKIPQSPEQLEMRALVQEAEQFGFKVEKGSTYSAVQLQKFIREEKRKRREIEAAEKVRQKRKEWLALSPEEKQARLAAAMSNLDQK
jgi:SAM-dependent methyltransferase